jgi:hypothetical protein
VKDVRGSLRKRRVSLALVENLAKVCCGCVQGKYKAKAVANRWDRELELLGKLVLITPYFSEYMSSLLHHKQKCPLDAVAIVSNQETLC